MTLNSRNNSIWWLVARETETMDTFIKETCHRCLQTDDITLCHIAYQISLVMKQKLSSIIVIRIWNVSGHRSHTAYILYICYTHFELRSRKLRPAVFVYHWFIFWTFTIALIDYFAREVFLSILGFCFLWFKNANIWRVFTRYHTAVLYTPYTQKTLHRYLHLLSFQETSKGTCAMRKRFLLED